MNKPLSNSDLADISGRTTFCYSIGISFWIFFCQAEATVAYTCPSCVILLCPTFQIRSTHSQEHKCATKDFLIRTLSEIVVKADDFGSATAVVRRLRETTFKPSYVVKGIDFNLDSLCKFIEESNARSSAINADRGEAAAELESCETVQLTVSKYDSTRTTFFPKNF